jgi:hypothetical protein
MRKIIFSRTLEVCRSGSRWQHRLVRCLLSEVVTKNLEVLVYVFGAMDHPVTITAKKQKITQCRSSRLIIDEERREMVNFNEAITELRRVEL